MPIKTKQMIVMAVWNGKRRRDEAFFKALPACGLTLVEFDRLGREARRVERGFMPGVILTPTGGQPR